MGWIILLPIGILLIISEKVAKYCSLRESRHGIGFLVCLLLGGAMVYIGYLLAFVGVTDATSKTTWPIAGGIGILCGVGSFFMNMSIISKGKIEDTKPDINTVSNTITAPEISLPIESTPEIQPTVPIVYASETIMQKEPVKQPEIKVHNIAIPATKSVRCPICKSNTMLRTVKKGKDTGKQFYVCVKYPECKGRVQVRKRAL